MSLAVEILQAMAKSGILLYIYGREAALPAILAGYNRSVNCIGFDDFRLQSSGNNDYPVNFLVAQHVQNL
ncbi:hypothetical protein D3C75_1288460 [compost metagenome]